MNELQICEIIKKIWGRRTARIVALTRPSSDAVTMPNANARGL